MEQGAEVASESCAGYQFAVCSVEFDDDVISLEPITLQANVTLDWQLPAGESWVARDPVRCTFSEFGSGATCMAESEIYFVPGPADDAYFTLAGDDLCDTACELTIVEPGSGEDPEDYLQGWVTSPVSWLFSHTHGWGYNYPCGVNTCYKQVGTVSFAAQIFLGVGQDDQGPTAFPVSSWMQREEYDSGPPPDVYGLKWDGRDNNGILPDSSFTGGAQTRWGNETIGGTGYTQRARYRHEDVDAYWCNHRYGMQYKGQTAWTITFASARFSCDGMRCYFPQGADGHIGP